MPGKEIDIRRKIKTIIKDYLEKKEIPCKLLVVQPEVANMKICAEEPEKIINEIKKRIVRYADIVYTRMAEMGEDITVPYFRILD